jgi:seryl-tRNA synthetase
MSKETKQDEFKVVLEDGKEVKFDDLKDEQKVMVNQIRDLDIQLGRMNFQAQQLQAAKNHFSAELNSSLKEEKEDA